MGNSVYFLTLFLSSAVSISLLLLPLRRKLRLPLTLGVLSLSAALLVAWIPSYLLSAAALSIASFASALINTSLMMLAGVLVLHFLTGTGYFPLLFLMLMTKSYSEYAFTVAIVSAEAFFPGRPYFILLIMAGIYLITLPLMLLFLTKLVRPLLENGDGQPFWKYLWLIPLGFYAVYCLGIYTNYLGTISLSATMMGLGIMLFWTLGTFATYFVVVKMLSITVEAARVQEQLTIAEMQAEMQHRRLESLQTAIEEAQRTRHDLRHHVATLRTMTQRGDWAAVGGYLDQLGNSTPPVLEQPLCENPVVDAIFGHYLTLCRAQDIETDIAVTIPRELGCKEQDVCVVLSNLLENACEACARQKQGPRTLRVRAHLSGESMLVMMVRNSFDGPAVTDTEGRFLSAKREGRVPGIGTQSVRSIAAKGGGAARFSFTDEEFTASVLLHL